MLPFTQSRLPEFVKFDTHEGVLHLIKLGYISVVEQMAIEAEVLKASTVHLQLLKLVRKICEQEGISREEAAAILDDPTSNMAIASRYTEDLEGILQNQAELGAKGRLEEVTAMIRFRAVHPSAFDESGKILPDCCEGSRVRSQYVGIPDWTAADTLGLDQELYKQIAAFADAERAKKSRKPPELRNKSPELNDLSSEELSIGAISTGD
jgi:hypothetical protein